MLNRRFTRHRSLFSTSVPRAAEPSLPLWRRGLSMLWRGFRRFCFAIGFLMVLSMVLGIYSASFFGKQAAPALPAQMVLYAALREDPPEIVPEIGFGGSFAAPPLTASRSRDCLS